MVLVVDDDMGLVNLLKTALEGEGYEVVTATDGVQAYATVRSPRCRCMLLDIRLPRINGVELLMLMQADGVDVPTIVMAGFGDFEEREMKQFTNVVKFLHKPFPMQTLLETIRGLGRA